jgi:hypothetical protein
MQECYGEDKIAEKLQGKGKQVRVRIDDEI